MSAKDVQDGWRFARCHASLPDGRECLKTELSCRMYGRDVGRACCPKCDHANGWRPE